MGQFLNSELPKKASSNSKTIWRIRTFDLHFGVASASLHLNVPRKYLYGDRFRIIQFKYKKYLSIVNTQCYIEKRIGNGVIMQTCEASPIVVIAINILEHVSVTSHSLAKLP